MNKATTWPLGSTAHAAKRAAEITALLQNAKGKNEAILIEHLQKILISYGEKEPRITPTDLEELKPITQKLQAIFTEPSTSKAALLVNTMLTEYARAPRLSSHGNTSWHIHVDSSDHAPWSEWLAASSALALAILLAEKQRGPWGLCASANCRRAFIDAGKGGLRKYCSEQCATRERVSAHRKKNHLPS